MKVNHLNSPLIGGFTFKTKLLCIKERTLVQMFVKPILYKDEVRPLTAFTEMNALRHCMSIAFTVDVSMYASSYILLWIV